MTNIRAGLLLALAMGLPLAAQVSSGDYESIRFRANAALENGNQGDALKLYEQALEVRRKAFGESSAPYAAALLDLARAYQASGKRSADVMHLYQQALPIQEATLGIDHPDVATTLFHMAMGTPHDAAHLDQARQLYQRALDIRTKAFGPSDPRTAEILTPVAYLTANESLYQRAITILEGAAVRAPAAATTLELYAQFLRARDRAGEAEPLEVRAKEMRTAQVAAIGSRRDSSAAAPLRVGGAVNPPKLKTKIEPEYTEVARTAKLQGRVILSLEISADGRARNIQLKNGIGLGLDEKAAESVSRWTFIPGTKDGQAVTVMATVEVNFKLM